MLYKNKKILLVYDNPLERRSIKSYLSRLGFTSLKEVGDGKAALEMIADETFDLIISDWRMKNLSGIELLRSVKQDPSARETLFILITAVTDKKSILKAVKSDVDGYIIKPFSPIQLREGIFKTFEKKMDQTARTIQAQLEKGQELKSSGNYSRALVEFRDALKMGETADAHYQIGDTYRRENRSREAITYFKRAIKNDFLFIHAYQSLGDIYLAEGNYSEAAEYLIKANRIDPSDPDAQLTLGEAYLKMGRLDKAEKIFKKVGKIALNSQKAMDGLCKIYIDNQNEDKAFDLIDRTLNKNSDKIKLFNRLGIIFRKNAEYGNAIKCYLKAIEIDPSDEVLRFNIAKAYFSSGDKEMAIEALRTSLQINPDFQESDDLLKKMLKAKEQE